jgi:hypothetical protein
MSKRHSAIEPAPQPSTLPASLPVWAKAAVSILLGLHLAAVFIAPLAVACDTGGSTSPAVNPLRRLLDPYITALYLNHGYFFFAPNPGPSHLVDYQVEFADGRQPVEGRFPNLATERPRLLYHRHFMLSESLYASFAPPEGPPEPSPPPLTAGPEERAQYQQERAAHAAATAAWRRQRDRYEAMRQSIERHLLAQHGGALVTLTRVEHRLPLPDEFTTLGRKLNAADSYAKLPEVAPRGSR